MDKSYHEMWGLGDIEYEVGDTVTRMGKDEQEIMTIDYGLMLLDVKCTKEGGCFKLGDVENNLIRRYRLVRKNTR